MWQLKVQPFLSLLKCKVQQPLQVSVEVFVQQTRQLSLVQRQLALLAHKQQHLSMLSGTQEHIAQVPQLVALNFLVVALMLVQLRPGTTASS